MKGILVRIKNGHVMDGEGEFLGNDSKGDPHTFWRSSGEMEIPLDLAIKLERERPQRFEIVDRNLIKDLGIDQLPEKSILNKPLEEKITLTELRGMTKDALNDWAAKRDYDLNPSKQKKIEMIGVLIKQIELRTGQKISG